MAAICNCESGIINSGLPNCTDGFGRIKKLMFVYQYANDGTKNTIDCDDLVSGTFFTDKVNEADKSKRFFPTALIYSVADVRATPVTETIDNIDRIVTQGVRTFLGDFADKGSNSPSYLKFLNSLSCPKIMYYGIDEYDNVVGVDLGNGILDGIPVQSQSFYSLYIPKTATTTAKNQIGFSVDDLLQDSTISYIPASDTGEDLLGLNGLLDVTLAEGVISGTFDFVSVIASLVYGNACTKLKFTAGTEITDWTVYNVTTALSVVVTTVTVTDENNYQLDFVAQNSGDVIQVTLSKEGFESETIEITFP
jgi:hypothetical protein